MNTAIKTVSQKYFTERFLNSEDYFARGNKRFFNIKKTICYEFGTHFGLVVEMQGEFIKGSGNNHNVLKIVSHDRKIETITSGFDGNRDGKKLSKILIDFIKNDLGFYEKEVVKKLDSVQLSNDYKNTLLFKSHDNKGFYLYFGSEEREDIKIISHL